MEKDFYFWFSIVSFVINIILTMAGVALWVGNRQEKQRRNAQVKIWMQIANGISQALARIIQDKWSKLYSEAQDVVNAVNAVEASSFALYQSLYEERTITEEEWKREQMDIRAQTRSANQQQVASNELTTTQTTTPIVQKRGRLQRIKNIFLKPKE